MAAANQMSMTHSFGGAAMATNRASMTRSFGGDAMAATNQTVSMEDLLGHLAKTSAELRRSEVDLRPSKGPRIPRSEDRFMPTWAPPPSKSDVKQLTMEKSAGPWVRFVKNAGTEFHADPGYLRGASVPVLQAARATMPPRSYAKLPSQIRYHAQSVAIPQPEDDLCTELHHQWLQRHRHHRDRHVHHIFHALEKLDKAKDKYESHARKRELTRALLTQGPKEDGPRLSVRIKASLCKVLTSVSTSRILTKVAGGVDMLAKDEAKDKAAFDMAKSVPCLQVRPPMPAGSVAHIRDWSGQNMSLRSFQTSTPWREIDEMRELKARGKLNTRGF